MISALPKKQGLYDPRFEHDACGVGFVVNIQGQPSHSIVDQALTVLENLKHRGACGCEANSGDGAGVLTQVPHEFMVRACRMAGIQLPDRKAYAVGMVFLPRHRPTLKRIQRTFAQIVAEEGLRVLGWRQVPTVDAQLGDSARESMPLITQVFLSREGAAVEDDGDAYERTLYVIRRRAENTIRYGGRVPGGEGFYVASLSHRTVVYKGLLTADQLRLFFPDLAHPAYESALGLVHSRFSTNTFPTWERAHPYRFVAHNGEINTLRGNVNWMRTREAMMSSALFGDDLQKLMPILAADGSDSAMFDNALELLVLAGRSLPHAVMMMVPEPFEHHENMSPEKRAFYRYHSCLMEPWDGPASVVFTDGHLVGASLDRNGLRPSRFYVTADRVILGSEVGALDVPPDQVLQKGRLQPGRMLLIDTRAGRIVADDELKQSIATERPYGEWLEQNFVRLADLPPIEPARAPEPTELVERQQAFGYSSEELRLILRPMAETGVEPVGSMGTDTPLAVLSNRPKLLYDYFKQLFAQVTNPPLDAIREAIVTATELAIGPEGNLLAADPVACRQLELGGPILSDETLDRLRRLNLPGLRAETLPILWDPTTGGEGLDEALEELFALADDAIADGATILILSDRGVGRTTAPIPALLATAGLHHHLIRNGSRTRVGLVLESGEPRQVHHFALLISYGVAAINPYLALESLEDLDLERYQKAAVKGVLKVISKMGISTFRSYCGAQIFEAIGLRTDLVEKYFTGTPTRIEGIGLDVIAEEVRQRHAEAFPARRVGPARLEGGGEYQWRADGEAHLFAPVTVHKLQRACWTNNYELFKEYSHLVDEQARERVTLRSMLELASSRRPIPLGDVEPVTAIMKRFKTGAMSYGSISREAHEALAIAMNRIGGKSNTGEGGEDPARYVPDANGDSRNSAIKQVASGRFGVTSHYLVNASEIQIKMAQGAKPGEGGQLPGHKVYPWVAEVRFSTPGVGLISPPPHHDIYSIEDLAQLIYDLKNANPRARISVKLVASMGVGTIACGVAKAHADVVLISGYDGGTGAAALTSIKNAGVPWELGLAETHQSLMLNGLRSRIAVETDGQLKTGRDVAVACLLGAEEFGFATAPLVVLGCVMMRVCHLNTCPVGVATQDPVLRSRFQGDPSHIVTFMRFVAQEMREFMAHLGFRTVDEMVGRSDCLVPKRATGHWKARGLDLSAIVHQVEAKPGTSRCKTVEQDHELEQSLDHTLLMDLCRPALERKALVRVMLPIKNTHRTVGTIVGSEVTRRHGAQGLPEDTIQIHFSGSAGQSFGAFVPPGMTLALEGDANDYLGKGLCGGKIVVYPPRESTFEPEDNIVIGNVAFYGATRGEAYIRGMAGERFCVRNSGVHAVVEAVGDHGCEYMTGGRVVVLGPTGRNFAAGMSGGVAYVLDTDGRFAQRCNREMVDVDGLDDPAEIEVVQSMIRQHALLTGSDLARRLLADWPDTQSRFRRIMPRDYRRMLSTVAELEAAGTTGEAAVLAAFERNARDLARAGGN